MSNISKSLTTFVLFLPILMVAGQAKAEMTSDQIKAAVSGKTFTFTGDDNGTASFAADGTAWLTLDLGNGGLTTISSAASGTTRKKIAQRGLTKAANMSPAADIR